MAEFRMSIDIAAPPDQVFEHLVTEEGITAWLGARAALEPVPGGRFAVDISGYSARGAYLVVDRPRRVVISWGFVGHADVPPASTTVSFDLTPTDTGTRLDLLHDGLPESALPGHATGWNHFLPRLRQSGAGITPPPDSWRPLDDEERDPG
jgi:uncharacterized protein YndB with AHSA1/START domain